MEYVDLAIALSIFILFLTVALVFSLNYFTKLPVLLGTEELRYKAINLYDILFKSKGTPEHWEETGTIPSEPGLLIDLYRIQLLIQETASLNRTDEPIEVGLTFDDDCINKTLNNTIRVQDESLNEVSYNFSNQQMCSGNFLKEANITFLVNISTNHTKQFHVFYHNKTVTNPNYNITYNTTSWIPNNGDSWTESTNDWSRYLGDSGTVALDSTNKKFGSNSVSIVGTFSSTNALGLDYNPTSNITGVSNGWYLRAWVLVDNTAGLSEFNISINDNTNVITKNISGITSNTWYLFEKEISSDNWANWTDFNASKGIDSVRFFSVNSTTGLTRILKIDGLRFEKKPLVVGIFPEEKIEAISREKLDILRNKTLAELTAIIGEGYKFRIEIVEK